MKHTDTKQLKDFLHLYLGCEVEHDSGKYIGTLTGVSFHTATIFCDYFKRDKHRVPKGKDFGEFTILTERLKPILRSLSSMTEEEAVECAIIVDCLPTGCIRDNKHTVIRLEYPNTGVAVKYNNYEFRITEKGAVYFYNTAHPNTAIYVNGTHEVFRYLLSKHFDLFGLIESGLAIPLTDKTLK